MQEFINKLVGIEFKDCGRDRSGLDCWGLILLIYRELFKVTIMDKDPEVSAMDVEQANAFFLEQTRLWQEVPIGKEKLGDVIVFKAGGWVNHAGMVVEPGLMIHTRLDLPTCIEHYNLGTWKTKMSGIFRYAKFTGNT
jgi:probable lipoprotein NlpC